MGRHRIKGRPRLKTGLRCAPCTNHAYPGTSVADPHVLGLPDPDPDPLVRGMDPDPDPALDPDPSIIMQK